MAEPGREDDEPDHDHERDSRDDRGSIPDEAVDGVAQQRRTLECGPCLLPARLGGAGEGGLELGPAIGDHQVLTSRVLGSRYPYRMSTTRLATMMISESMIVMPIVTE